MVLDTQWILFSGLLLALALSFCGLRKICLAAMKKTVADSSGQSLLPVELAYLIRPSDSVHCLIVLAVDLLQKGIKEPAAASGEAPAAASGEPPTRHYEKAAVASITAYIKDWTLLQAQSLVPELVEGNPIKIARGFWRLRQWLFDGFKNLQADLIKDPRNLKRYFAPAGIMRILLTLIGAGVREPLMRDLQNTLLERGLMLSVVARQRFAGYLSALAGASLLSTAVLSFYLSPVQNWVIVFLAALASFLNGVVLRLAAELPAFLPFYEEVALTLSSIGRKSIRVTILRGVLTFLRSVFWFALGSTAAVIAVLQALALAFLFPAAGVHWLDCFCAIVSLTVSFIVAADVFFLSLRVSNTEQKSRAGEQLLKRYQSKMRHISPITAFSAALTEKSYTEELADIVALYGIETLFLLA
jgi:hypothetical protein